MTSFSFGSLMAFGIMLVTASVACRPMKKSDMRSQEHRDSKAADVDGNKPAWSDDVNKDLMLTVDAGGLPGDPYRAQCGMSQSWCAKQAWGVNVNASLNVPTSVRSDGKMPFSGTLRMDIYSLDGTRIADSSSYTTQDGRLNLGWFVNSAQLAFRLCVIEADPYYDGVSVVKPTFSANNKCIQGQFTGGKVSGQNYIIDFTPRFVPDSTPLFSNFIVNSNYCPTDPVILTGDTVPIVSGGGLIGVLGSLFQTSYCRNNDTQVFLDVVNHLGESIDGAYVTFLFDINGPQSFTIDGTSNAQGRVTTPKVSRLRGKQVKICASAPDHDARCILATAPTNDKDLLLVKQSALTLIKNKKPVGAFGLTGKLDIAGFYDPTAVIKGWAVDPDHSRPASIQVTVGSVLYSVTTSLPNSDACASVSSACNRTDTGFELRLSDLDLPDGEWNVAIQALNVPEADGDSVGAGQWIDIQPTTGIKVRVPMKSFAKFGQVTVEGTRASLQIIRRDINQVEIIEGKVCDSAPKPYCVPFKARFNEGITSQTVTVIGLSSETEYTASMERAQETTVYHLFKTKKAATYALKIASAGTDRVDFDVSLPGAYADDSGIVELCSIDPVGTWVCPGTSSILLSGTDLKGVRRSFSNLKFNKEFGVKVTGPSGLPFQVKFKTLMPSVAIALSVQKARPESVTILVDRSKDPTVELPASLTVTLCQVVQGGCNAVGSKVVNFENNVKTSTAVFSTLRPNTQYRLDTTGTDRMIVPVSMTTSTPNYGALVVSVAEAGPDYLALTVGRDNEEDLSVPSSAILALCQVTTAGCTPLSQLNADFGASVRSVSLKFQGLNPRTTYRVTSSGTNELKTPIALDVSTDKNFYSLLVPVRLDPTGAFFKLPRKYFTFPTGGELMGTPYLTIKWCTSDGFCNQRNYLGEIHNGCLADIPTEDSGLALSSAEVDSPDAWTVIAWPMNPATTYTVQAFVGYHNCWVGRGSQIYQWELRKNQDRTAPVTVTLPSAPPPAPAPPSPAPSPVPPPPAAGPTIVGTVANMKNKSFTVQLTRSPSKLASKFTVLVYKNGTSKAVANNTVSFGKNMAAASVNIVKLSPATTYKIVVVGKVKGDPSTELTVTTPK